MAKTKVKASKNGQMPLGKHIAKNWRLYMFLVIPIIYYLVFRYQCHLVSVMYLKWLDF